MAGKVDEVQSAGDDMPGVPAEIESAWEKAWEETIARYGVDTDIEVVWHGSLDTFRLARRDSGGFLRPINVEEEKQQQEKTAKGGHDDDGNGKNVGEE